MSSKKHFLLSIISCLFLFPSALNARDLDEYWYGIGVGMSELLCTLKSNGIISNKYMNSYMREYLIGAKTLDRKVARIDKFEDGISLVNSIYPSCNLRS